MKEFFRGGLMLVVCSLAATQAHAQGAAGSFPTMAPGPGAATASPTQAPGVAPPQPMPTTETTAAPAAPAPAAAPPAAATPSDGAAATAAAPTEPATPLAAATADPAMSALPEPPTQVHQRFGDRGELVFSELLGASFGVLGYSKSSAGSSTFGLSPAFDYFVDQDVFVGVSSFLRYSSNTTAQRVKSYGWSGGAYVHFGRNVPLSNLFSLKIKVALGASHASSTIENPNFDSNWNGFPFGVSHAQETIIVVDMYAPLLIHPAPHFFVGFGPEAYFDPYHSIGGDAGSTTDHMRYFVGASSTIGGWF
jgi:hypothetical protein